MRLLLIEDDADLANTIAAQLRGSYALDIALTGKEGFFLACTTPYDVLILDLGLPDIGGLELCAKLRTDEVAAPILILTAAFDLTSKVAALDAGADDYLTKPFETAELQARIRSLIRRGPCLQQCATIQFAELVMNTASRTVSVRDVQFYLKRKEFDILEMFFRNQERIVTRAMLLEHVWDGDANDLTNSVDVHIGRLRKRIRQILGRDIIRTVYGFGYRLSAAPSFGTDPFALLEEAELKGGGEYT